MYLPPFHSKIEYVLILARFARSAYSCFWGHPKVSEATAPRTTKYEWNETVNQNIAYLRALKLIALPEVMLTWGCVRVKITLERQNTR